VDEHGSFGTCLENALLKAVQLGLHAGLPPLADAMAYYLNKAKQLPGKPYRSRTIASIHWLGCSLLACAGFTDSAVIGYLRESLHELYIFALKGSCDIYCDEEERAALKGIPSVYKDRKIIKSGIANVHGFCYPLIYDIVGLSSLYRLGDPEADQQIDAVIRYISTDAFHNTVADGYGVLPPYQRKYHMMGWDPKYPDWFNAGDHMENANASKLLFFALYIGKYPAARCFFLSMVSPYLHGSSSHIARPLIHNARLIPFHPHRRPFLIQGDLRHRMKPRGQQQPPKAVAVDVVFALPSGFRI